MDHAQRLRRIAVLSRRLRRALRIAAVFIALALCAAVLGTLFGGDDFQLRVGEVSAPAGGVSIASRMLVLSLLAPLVVLGGWLLWCWDRLLRLYEAGVVLGAENGALIRRCGQLVIGLAVADTVVIPACMWVLSSAAGEGQLTLDPNLGLLFVGCGVVVVGHVMTLGAEMAEEASLTI